MRKSGCLIIGLFLLVLPSLAATPSISHGPMLGAVSEHAVRIWLRTTEPADVTCALFEVGTTSRQQTQKDQTKWASNNTCIITFDTLKKETEYQYVIRVGDSECQATFTTLGPSLTQKGVRIVYLALKNE